MAGPRILVAFYSAHGTNKGVAELAASAAKGEGAETRLRRFAETAPREAVEADDAWAATMEAVHDIPEIGKDDMEWAQGYFFAVPTHYGAPPGQMTAFTDTLGPLWKNRSMCDKTFTASTAAQMEHGGQEGTLRVLYAIATHWGCILVPPGYADPVKFDDGGNPYGYSLNAGAEPDEESIRYQACRLVSVTARLFA